SVLNRHFKNQKSKQSHLDYLEKILKDIDPVYIEKFREIKNSIELTLLNNTESENEVVSYLSGVSEKLNLLSRKRGALIKKEVNTVCA
ncbi:MAG: hypothetical protein Q9M94_07185, partial [Candidatus Gracilibacteria bacterium]|nr:hypothetical protein [Candidatus Gracilibacteria bacterium]